MRFYLLLPLLVGVLFFSGTAFAYTSPGQPSGFLNDFAGMLSGVEVSALESTLKNFQEKSGGEISVVTIPTLSGDAIEEFANTLFREWGIGNKNGNLGVLLLVSQEERALRIEVGYGYEGGLTDAKSSEIIRNTIVPYFQREEYGPGITAGVFEIIGILQNPQTEEPIHPTPENAWSTLLIVITVMLSFLASILGRSKSWWLGGLVGGVIGYGLATFGLIFISKEIMIAGLAAAGLLFDYVVSSGYKNSISIGSNPPWWTGGSRGGGFGGGFGGFGGGSSGGGGASGRW